MFVVFLRKRITKHTTGFAYATQTFHGDVWQEAQAVIEVEERWGLIADAAAIAQAERSRMKLAESVMNTRTPVLLSCVGGVVVTGLIQEVGTDVIVIQEFHAEDAAVRLQSVLRIEGVIHSLRVEECPEPTSAPLMMTGWLRSHISEAIQCHMIDGWAIRGELEEVGEDFLTVRSDDDRQISLVTQHISVIRSLNN
jgi:hypothetical protein